MITIDAVDNEASKVNTNPTEPQRSAGNYRMGHISVKGMKIAIENPKGSRRYYGKDGRYNIMQNHYGYFNVTKGKDGDAVDVFLGPYIDDFENVYCVDQNKADGEFDETKVMLGFHSKEEAKEAYLSNYDDTWDGFRDITAVSIKDFKKWLYRGRKQRQPFADYVYIQKKKLDENMNGGCKQIQLGPQDEFFDYELFDNGNANYYFTTDEPLSNNAATLEEFFSFVKETDRTIKWDFDYSYGGGQAFGTRRDGMEIQLDAAGNGDFCNHVVSVEVLGNATSKNMVNELHGRNADLDMDELIYYAAIRFIAKCGFHGDKYEISDAVYDSMDMLSGDMEGTVEECGRRVGIEAMKTIDYDYYKEEVEPFLLESKVVRLSESDVRAIIANAVKRYLNENKLTRDDDYTFSNNKFDDVDMDYRYEQWKAQQQPKQEDWDDFGSWASKDEPNLDEFEPKAPYPLDADDEGEGYTQEYMAGVRYGKNLIYKSKVPAGLADELDKKEDEGTITAFELGVLDALTDIDR